MTTRTSPRWPIGTWGAFGLAFLLIVGHYLAWLPGGLVSWLLGIKGRREIWQASPAAFLATFTVAAFEMGLVLRVGMCRFARLSFRAAGWDRFARRDVGYGVLGFAIFAVAVTCIYAADSGFGGAVDDITDAVVHYTPQQRLLFVLMGLYAAIPEETIFRGIMQPTLQAKLGRWPGLLLTACIFALYHPAYAVPRIVGHLCHGLILGVLRDRTGTLWAPATAHVLAWSILGSL